MNNELAARRTWYEDRARYEKELARGKQSELLVVLSILPTGLWVKMDDGRTIAKDDPALRDQRDVSVEGDHILEIKGRSLAFSGPDDYPFDSVLLGSIRKWNGRRVLPCTIVVCSELTGAMVVIPVASKKHWVVEQRYDSLRRFTDLSYAVDKSHLLSWNDLLEHLKQPCCSRELLSQLQQTTGSFPNE